jgi:hypothetical protein
VLTSPWGTIPIDCGNGRYHVDCEIPRVRRATVSDISASKHFLLFWPFLLYFHQLHRARGENYRPILKISMPKIKRYVQIAEKRTDGRHSGMRTQGSFVRSEPINSRMLSYHVGNGATHHSKQYYRDPLRKFDRLRSCMCLIPARLMFKKRVP